MKSSQDLYLQIEEPKSQPLQLKELLWKYWANVGICQQHMGTQINSQVTREVAAVLGEELKTCINKSCADRWYARTHSCHGKTTLKAATGEFCQIWHKILPLAGFNHNTTYHQSLGCEATPAFHGRIPHNLLHYQLGYNPNPISPQSEIAEEVQRRMTLLNYQTKKNTMQSFLKYKHNMTAK